MQPDEGQNGAKSHARCSGRVARRCRRRADSEQPRSVCDETLDLVLVELQAEHRAGHVPREEGKHAQRHQGQSRQAHVEVLAHAAVRACTPQQLDDERRLPARDVADERAAKAPLLRQHFVDDQRGDPRIRCRRLHVHADQHRRIDSAGLQAIPRATRAPGRSRARASRGTSPACCRSSNESSRASCLQRRRSAAPWHGRSRASGTACWPHPAARCARRCCHPRVDARGCAAAGGGGVTHVRQYSLSQLPGSILNACLNISQSA